MIFLDEIVDREGLRDALAARYVASTDHPTLDLRILNYTASCQYDRAWSDVTRACRGLIYRPSTQEVVARPWPKFFNYGEHPEGSLDLNAPAEVTDKMDGSLGILYPADDGYAIATRGSFTSDQALHATARLRELYGDFNPHPELTYLFELIHPANRIVLDYSGADDLFLLGAVMTETGVTVGPRDGLGWPGPRTELLPVFSLREALELEPRPNAEGIVVRFVGGGGALIKIKQDDYVALHRIVTGLNERIVWEHLGEGGTVAELCEPIPDEFHSWVEEVAERLFAERDAILASAHSTHAQIADAPTRKDYALRAVEYPELKPYLFMLLDGKDPVPAIWRTIRPAGERPLVRLDEATA